MATTSCPPFGRGSIDMAAIQAAAAKDKLTPEAISKATTLPDPPAKVEREPEPKTDAGAPAASA